MRGTLAIVAVLAGCGEAETMSADAGPPPPTSMSVTLGFGEWLEAELDLPAGGSVAMSYDADTFIDWNVHRHADGAVEYLVEESAPSEDHTFTAVEAGRYWLMWENRVGGDATLEVTLTLGAGGVLVGWE